jgi:Protein of unknown function (DUF1566)
MKHKRAMASVITTVFCAFLISGVLNLRAAPRGGAQAPGAKKNGDVNCDGGVDISDAIYLLVNLFQGGPAPCAIAQTGDGCCPELSQKIDKLIEAVNDPCRVPENRLVLHDDGTVTDRCAGLLWKSTPFSVDIDQDGQLDQVLGYNQVVNSLKTYAFAGYDDWRLPTMAEAESLMRAFASKPYTIEFTTPEFQLSFNRTEDNAQYWTSTAWNESPGYNFLVRFGRDNSITLSDRRTDRRSLRPPRPPRPRAREEPSAPPSRGGRVARSGHPGPRPPAYAYRTPLCPAPRPGGTHLCRNSARRRIWKRCAEPFRTPALAPGAPTTPRRGSSWAPWSRRPIGRVAGAAGRRGNPGQKLSIVPREQPPQQIGEGSARWRHAYHNRESSR